MGKCEMREGLKQVRYTSRQKQLALISPCSCRLLSRLREEESRIRRKG
jgi:hypothetical protein